MVAAISRMGDKSAMTILGFPWHLVTAGIGLVFLYSLGEYGRGPYQEYFRVIGFCGSGILILMVYWSYCPITGTYFVFLLLATALTLRLVLWVLYKTKDAPRPPSSGFED